MSEKRPTRAAVDFAFWGAHLLFLVAFISAQGTDAGEVSDVSAISLILGIILLFVYFFAIGRYASNRGRSALLWGGLSFIFSPVGVWVSYVLCLFWRSEGTADDKKAP